MFELDFAPVVRGWRQRRRLDERQEFSRIQTRHTWPQRPARIAVAEWSRRRTVRKRYVYPMFAQTAVRWQYLSTPF